MFDLGESKLCGDIHDDYDNGGGDEQHLQRQRFEGHRGRLTENSHSAVVNWAMAPKYKLAALVDSITEELDQEVPGETIHLCGLSPLFTLAARPADALGLAHEKLYTWPYDEIPTEWRRLYEDACIRVAVQELEKIFLPDGNGDHPALNIDCHNISMAYERYFASAVKHLDKAVFVAGAPGRKFLIDSTLEVLEAYLAEVGECPPKSALNAYRPQPLNTSQPIPRLQEPIALEAFQSHLDCYGGPLIIPGTFKHWPALSRWPNMRYLLQRTLGGRRTVPVEIGISYTDEAWTQEVMTFNDFVERFLDPQKHEEVGYLAQHDLLDQIPRLRDDLTVPDYCYASPPVPTGAAALTFGLSNTRQVEEPHMNAWLGPRGTKTPLHTDTYHNILSQVVGYKYVRLYAPEEKTKLYPMDVDESGVSMGNTSQIEVRYTSAFINQDTMDENQARELDNKFPLFKEAKYQEAIIGPGECLYIPLGWWHYVESLTNSFSVSFWFN